MTAMMPGPTAISYLLSQRPILTGMETLTLWFATLEMFPSCSATGMEHSRLPSLVPVAALRRLLAISTETAFSIWRRHTRFLPGTVLGRSCHLEVGIFLMEV